MSKNPTESSYTPRRFSRRTFVAGCLSMGAFCLIGCGKTSEPAKQGTEDDPIVLDEFEEMPAGEIWVKLPDGTIDKFENGQGGHAYGVEYFLEEFSSDEARYSRRYEGAVYVAHLQVKSIKENWLTRSGDTFETALELTGDRGYLKKNGYTPATDLTVEADWDDVDSQSIAPDDSIIVASKRFDYRFDNLYAPVTLKKLAPQSSIPKSATT